MISLPVKVRDARRLIRLPCLRDVSCLVTCISAVVQTAFLETEVCLAQPVWDIVSFIPMSQVWMMQGDRMCDSSGAWYVSVSMVPCIPAPFRDASCWRDAYLLSWHTIFV
ncbi:hypothetical protein GQ472_00745 [archaeon]|nr:hypothetical protein [archaeon]